jgi:hypothetical protein
MRNDSAPESQGLEEVVDEHNVAQHSGSPSVNPFGWRVIDN